MNEESKPVYEFGPFRIVSAEGLVTRNGQAIRLTPKSFDLLVFLVQNRGRVLDKETLLAGVWPGTFVEESNLTKNVSLLRQCLGDREDGRPYIETFSRRGYRFDADLREYPKAELRHDGRFASSCAGLCNPVAFVGRERELGILTSLMEQAIHGAGRIVLLSGEAGIGKTALAESFFASLRQHPDALTARGVCVEQYGAGEAYLPFLEAMSSLLRTAAREWVLTALRANAPTWCLHLCAILSQAERERIQLETIGATTERMLREMGDFLSAFTSSTPLVLLLEDMHWADTSGADLLRALGRRIAGQHLLIVGTFRPEDLEIGKHPLRNDVCELLAHSACTEIRLEALELDQVHAYLDARFAPNDFPADLAALLARKTEGHPLFLSAMAELLIQRGDITLSDGCWILARRPAELALEVPQNVVSIIRKRLERLDEGELRALECAAVEGEEFTSAMVSALTGIEEVTVEEQLDRIDRVHKLLRRLGEEELPDGSLAIRYRFAHSLYQKALYDGLVPARRIALHRRAGKELLRLRAGQQSQAAAQLATHFERGRDFSPAVEHLIETGDNACRLYDNMAALRHYSHALELTGKLPAPERPRRRLAAFQKRGAAQMALGRLSDAEEDLRRALDEARVLGDAVSECVVLNALANALVPSHKLADLERVTAEAMNIAERIGSPALRAEAMTNLGLVSMACGGGKASARLLDEAIPSARACNHAAALLPALTFRGLLHNFHSEYQQAEMLETEAAALAAQARDGFYLPLALFYLGIIQANLGRFSDALATLADGMEMSNRNGNRVVLSRVPNAMGWIYRELRDLPKAIEQDRMSAAMAKEMKLAEAEAHALINLAHDYALAGGTEAAKTCLHDAEALLEHDPWYRWRFFEIRFQEAATEVLLLENELDRAQRNAELLLANAARHESPKYVALAKNLLSRIAMAAGEPQRAAILLGSDAAGTGCHPTPLTAWKNCAELGRALAMINDREGAQRAFSDSARVLQSLVEHTRDGSLRDTFLNAPDIMSILAELRSPNRPLMQGLLQGCHRE